MLAAVSSVEKQGSEMGLAAPTRFPTLYLPPSVSSGWGCCAFSAVREADETSPGGLGQVDLCSI